MTNRASVVLLCAVLAALVVGTWIAFSGPGGRTSQAAARAPLVSGESSGDTDEAMRPGARGDARPGTHRDQIDPLPAAPPPSTAGDAIEPPPEDALDVLVRVRATKEPVPGAIVLFADWSLLSEEEQYEIWWSEAGPLAGLERLGRRYRADEGGVVRVPRPSDGGMAACEHGTLYGRLDLDSDASARRTLELEPDRVLLARVIDVDGTPAPDVTVGLRVTTQWWSWDVLRGRTGADGLARLAHAQAYLGQGFDPSQRFALGIVMHARESVEVELDPHDLPSDPIELRLPPHGSVEVVLEPRAGAEAAATEKATVFLQEIEREDEGNRYQSWPPQFLRDGRTVFPIIGLGLRFQAQAQSTASEIPPQEFAGPLSAGETVVVHLVPGAQRPRIAGRALLEDGSALARVRLRGSIQFHGVDNEWNAEFAATTDDEGRFSASFGQVEDGGAAGALELNLEDRIHGKLAGSVPLSGRLLPGANDVGEVRLLPPPLLVSGRVVDAAGQGVRGAHVSLDTSQEGREFPALQSAVARFVRWGGLQGISMADGSFEVRGELAGDIYQLGVSHADYQAPAPLEVHRGEHVQVVLVGAGRIAGRLQTDAGVFAGSLQLVVLDALGTPQSAEERREGDGRFELGSLAPGTYALAVTLAEEEAELARVDGLVVEAGRTNEDPRLDPLDVEHKLTRIVVHVRNRDGAPPEELAIARRTPGEARYREPSWWGGEGEIVLITAQSALDLRIDAQEARTVELFGVSGEVEVNLGPGLPIELDLSSVQERIGPSVGLYVELVHLPEGEGRMDSQGQSDARGWVACSVGEPGEWGVRAYLIDLGSQQNDSMSVQLGGSRLATIHVADTRSTQIFPITVDAETLAAALRELGR